MSSVRGCIPVLLSGVLCAHRIPAQVAPSSPATHNEDGSIKASALAAAVSTAVVPAAHADSAVQVGAARTAIESFKKAGIFRILQFTAAAQLDSLSPGQPLYLVAVRDSAVTRLNQGTLPSETDARVVLQPFGVAGRLRTVISLHKSAAKAWAFSGAGLSPVQRRLIEARDQIVSETKTPPAAFLALEIDDRFFLAIRRAGQAALLIPVDSLPADGLRARSAYELSTLLARARATGARFYEEL